MVTRLIIQEGNTTNTMMLEAKAADVSPLISFQGELLVEILTYLPPLNMLNFALSSVGVMRRVSDAAESVLNNMVESVKSDGDGNVSYLNEITQDSDETCMLSGNRKWGVFSRINQINHYSSIVFAPALGGATLLNEEVFRGEGCLLQPARLPHGNCGFAHTRFIMAHGKHHVKFRFQCNRCDGFNVWTSFGIARPLSYNKIDRPNLDVADFNVMSLYPEGWHSQTLINIVNVVPVHNLMDWEDFGFHFDVLRGRFPDYRGDEYYAGRKHRWRICNGHSVYGLKLDMDEGKLSLFVQEGSSMILLCDLADALTGGFVWTARAGRDGIDPDFNPGVVLVQWDLMECPIIESD